MKKMMLVSTIFVLCTGCTTPRNTIVENKENKEEINEKLTNVNDWSKADKVIDEVMTFRQDNALSYEPHGIYDLAGYTSKVYTFDYPNNFYEVVMADDSEDFIVIIHNTGDHGVSFHSMVYKGRTFYGLTRNYILFKEDDNSISAVSIKKKESLQVGDYAFQVIDFNNLPKDEQRTAVYPNGYYYCEF